VADDDLTVPLGRNAKKTRRFKWPFRPLQALASALALFVGSWTVWALVADNPLGGEPVAVIAVHPTTPGKAGPATSVATLSDKPGQAPRRYDGPNRSAAAIPVQPDARPTAGVNTITIIDGSTGKRQEVAIPASTDRKAPAEQHAVENSTYGAIPRIAPDGTRPADLYAQRADTPASKKNAPRIAIVVGGLGISANLTQAAIKTLPAPVTFAFSPYGSNIERVVARARADGHEALLQAPMEPFDFPDNDPGPHALLTSLSASQNLDRLHWLMSRFQGYVGIVNAMGARFTASEPALAPVLKDIAARGLIYVDNGSSPRSLAGRIAGASGMPFAQAEIVLDAVPTAAHIDAALASLEAVARERGSAVGIASVLPVSIERIAQWAKAAEDHGVVLVPITAVAIKPKSS
jgi:polysaccharide deacetylase 2 family uncharacterized protein YibQ